MKPCFDAIPQELRALPNWVLWRLEKVADKKGVVRPSKVPYNVRNGKRARSDNPATWAPFLEAVAVLERGSYDGIGFCLTPPYVGADLDGCRQNETDEPWAAEIIRELDSVHRNQPFGHWRPCDRQRRLAGRATAEEFKDREHHGVGLHDAARGRYLTITGHRIAGNGVIRECPRDLLARIHGRLFPPEQAKAKRKSKSPPSPVNGATEADDDLLERARKAKNGIKFLRLWDGHWEGDYPSQSEADQALCMMLAFWADRDAGRIDTLFRRSELMREKWDRADYREATIAEAIERTTETWKPAERTSDSPDLIPFHFADTGNAERLVRLHGANLRYCFGFRKWMIWDGRRWAVDETGRALKLAKRTMVSFLRQAVDSKNEAAERFARASLDARRLNAMLALAQSELPITPDELDRNRSLLNFTNGTVDLRTGKLRPHRRDDWITKIVAFPYRPQATCPVWLAFLDEIMGGGPDRSEADLKRADELTGFLQLALGYSITGEVSEKAVFVAHGGGDNGKTTLLSAVRDLIHDFAVTIGLDLLMTKDDSNNVAAARAKLLGVRFASSSETEEGQKLSAARLKRICQGPGGEIEACRKYENPITFPETHKLWIDANYRPELPATDAAVWNRLHLIPFTVTIPKERQDRELTTKLLKEGEGILAWLVEGARQWYAKGLPHSEVVNKATKAWQQELDRLRVYLDEYTEKSDDKEAWLLNKTLYEAYKSWCEENGERFLSHIRFARQMEAMEYQKGERRN